MKHSIPFLLVQALINLLITGVAIWIALRIVEALLPPGSDPFGAVITGVGLLIALTVAGGAVWMLALSLRDQFLDGPPRQAARPSPTHSTAAFASDPSFEASGSLVADNLIEWPPETSCPASPEGGSELGAAEAACEPGDSDTGGDFAGDLGGMDAGGSGG
jgi:hypothetical protein